VTGQVGDDDVPSGGGERRDVIVEVLARPGEAVDEQERTPARTRFRRRQPDPHRMPE
jgi:hypothetical protein